MSSQKIIGTILIIVFAAISALMIRSGMSTPKGEKVPVQHVRVVTADLPAGALIQASDLGWQEIAGTPGGDLFAEAQGPEDKVLGAVVRLPLAKGQPIERSRIVLPDAPGFLSAALAPGKRAVSVAITDVSGNAGMIQPGDRVDIILTQHIAGGATTGPDVVGETVLTNVRVIAVGRQFFVEKPDAKANGNGGGARTVTFEVDGQQAERVTVATQLGDLSLALRSLASELGHMRQEDGSMVPLTPENQEKPRPVHAADVSEAGPHPAAPESTPTPSSAPATVKVYRGAEKSN